MARADRPKCSTLITAAVIEPFGFFSWDSLRAGWYLSWRVFVRVLPVFAVSVLVGFVLMKGSPAVGGFLMSLGICAGGIWSLVLVPKLTSRWAQERYGYPLENALQVWWGITWRSLVVSLVAAVIMAVPNVVALSVKTAYSDSLLGGFAGLMLWLLSLANIAVSILATGWGMSRVTASQLSGFEPIAPTLAESMPAPPLEPVAVPAVERAPAPRAAPRAAPVATASPAASAEGKRQCPKCGLYETERGTVIGWYCKVCGWREARR
jgi:hypothetical protein